MAFPSGSRGSPRIPRSHGQGSGSSAVRVVTSATGLSSSHGTNRHRASPQAGRSAAPAYDPQRTMLSPSRRYQQDLDDTARHALTAHHFQSDFDAKDFIERVSGGLVLQSKRTSAGNQFDAPLFTRHFDIVAQELGKMQREIDQQMRDVEHVVQNSEAEYRATFQDIKVAFTKITHNFGALEGQVNGIGTAPIHIGEQLESIEREKMRAADVNDLIDFFTEFGRSGRSSRLEEMLVDGGPDGQCKAAIVTRRLNSIIQDSGDLGTSDRAKANIEQFCERLERDLLDSFDRSYRQRDTATMASCARALIEFNGGASCVQTYVNQHDFFMKMAEDQLNVAQDSYQSLAGINDLYTIPSSLENSLTPFFIEIRKMLRQEWDVISAVFPNALAVMQVLTQRVFAQSIQNYLENLLQLAEKDSQLAYLRILAMFHLCAGQLVSQLKHFDQDVIMPFLTSDDAGNGSSATSNSGNRMPTMALSTTMLLGTQSAASFSVTLGRCMDDLFVPYIENERYVDVETRFLMAVFQTTVAKFLGYATQRRVQKPKNVFSRTINQITGSAAGDGPEGGAAGNPPNDSGLAPSPLSKSGPGYSLPTLAASLSQFTSRSGGGQSPTPASPIAPGHTSNGGAGSLHSANSLSNRKPMQTVLSDEEVEQDETLPTVTRCLQLLKVHAEAMTRCVELSLSTDVPKHAVLLFGTLTEFLGGRYLDPALEIALDDLNDAPKGSEPDFRTFYTLRGVNQTVHLVQCHFQSVVVPLVASSPSHYREIMGHKNEFTLTLEHRLNQLVLRQIAVTATFFQTVLSRQRKQDYRPRDEDFQALSLATEPCGTIVDFLDRLHKTVIHCFDSKNQEQVLVEVGAALYQLLLEHYRSFVVSPLGGLVVSEDIAKYQEAIKKFHLPSLDERFAVLRNLGTIFLVRSDVLQSLLDEDTDLGRMDSKFLAPYLQMREDYRSARLGDLMGRVM
ncbi:Exocyst complex component 5 [Dimargaris verticillata]|uniref:Exocyst complex component 5 n=1 Tax=Dimargaris verticillata TaxID=2761393 RepID=A0A9W8B2C8_9FUNG|nr:Exocyst complex component 5 [Dimargaris verticillata]